ncbi:MAG: GNAT family N-acetyltransferase [Cyanobacteria bacterium K_Offshore_surface_m2_239]|nr:GNAT family N-acetyltransferase [Cyanobacteria bacterium K_Offshore_surface_m2_239]
MTSPLSPLNGSARIVRLGPEDGAACLGLDRLALGGLWSAEQWERELSEPKRPVLGWRQDPCLLAMASAWIVLEELQITAVAVHPEHRRRGLARQLLEALLRLGQEAGAERATLEVAKGNEAARALYAGLGFQEVALRRGYYRNGDDALVQWRKLDGGFKAPGLARRR